MQFPCRSHRNGMKWDCVQLSGGCMAGWLEIWKLTIFISAYFRHSDAIRETPAALNGDGEISVNRVLLL